MGSVEADSTVKVFPKVEGDGNEVRGAGDDPNCRSELDQAVEFNPN